MDATVVSRRARALCLILGLVVAAGALPADAASSSGPTVQLGSSVGLAADGSSVVIDVIASCPERWSVVRATVSVSQPQASGQGAFPLTCIGSARSFRVSVPSSGGTFTPTCDGLRHTVNVGIQASQGLFRPGSAQGIAFAFVEEGGNSFSGIDEHPIEIVTT